MNRLLTDDEFFGAGGGGSSLLTDEQFLGGGSAAEQDRSADQPASNRGKALLSDDEFMGGPSQESADKADFYEQERAYLRDRKAKADAAAEQPVEKAEPRTAESGGFIDQIKKGFISGLVDQNPEMVGNAMEAIADLTEPSGAAAAGRLAGSLVPPPGGKVDKEAATQPSELRVLADKVKTWAAQGSDTRQPRVPSVTAIRTDSLSDMISDAADYAGYLIGSGVGTSAPSVAAGVAGASLTKSPLGFLASAAGPSYVQNLGDTYGALLQDEGVQKAIADGKITRKQVASIAAGAAVPMAALDTVSAEKVIGLNTSAIKQGILKRVLHRVGIGALTEGTTEGVQQVVQEAAVEAAGGDKTLAQQAVSVIDNAIGGALAGGAMSAGSSPLAGSLAPEPTPQRMTEQNIPEGAAPADTLFGQESAEAVTSPTADTAAGGPPHPPAATAPLRESLVEPSAPSPLEEASTIPSPVDVERERPDSPRLTPEDRASPLPNNLIDDGKKIFEDALSEKRQAAAPEVEPTAETTPLSPPAAPPARVDPIGGTMEPAAPEIAPARPAAGRIVTDEEFMGGQGESTAPVPSISTASEPENAPAVTAHNPRLLPDHEFLTAGETHPEPTPAQAEAGNYAKRHVKVHGLDVSIETEQGGIRRSKPGAAEPWEVEMPAHYGYIRRTEGSDGDHLDVYLGPQTSDKVYVIDQVDAKTKAYDEHKVMIDFPSREAAVQAYEKAFSDGKGAERIGAITEMPMFGFKSWLKTGDTKAPLSYAGPAIAQLPQDQIIDNSEQTGIAPSASDELRNSSRISPEPTPVDVKQRKRAVQKGPQDLFQFIAGNGGIRDDRGELRSLGLDKVFVPGYGKLVRPNGKPIDTQREAAEEAGFIGEAGKYQITSTADLYDALEQQARGQRRFSRHDQGIADQIAAERKFGNEGFDRVRDEVEGRAADLGLHLNEETHAAILDRINDGMDIEEAVSDVAEAHALAFEHETHDSRGQGEPNVDDIPFFDDAEAPVTGAAFPAGEGVAYPGGDREGADEGAARGGEAPREQPGSAEPDGRAAQGEVSAEDRTLLADFPEGFHFIEGRGQLGRGTWAVAGADGRAVWNYEKTKAAAARSTQQRLANVANYQRESAARAEQEQDIAKRLLSGEYPTDADLRFLDLKLSSRFDYLSPVVQRLFGLSNRKVREAMGDALKHVDNGMGSGAMHWVGPAKKALRNAAAWVNAQNGQAAVTTEAGAEGKPQTVIPGAERISQGEQAQRGADERMRPKVAQKDAGALFDTQANSERQEDMFSAKPSEPDPQRALKEKIAAKRAEVPAAPAARIEDFGEKIEGARKDQVNAFRDQLAGDVDIATEPLSKIFPQPNYEKLADAGVDKRALALIAVAREQIPAKPRANWKVKRWAEQVRVLRDFAHSLVDGRFDPDMVTEALKGSAYLRKLGDTAAMISTMDAADLPFAAKWSVESGTYSFFGGQRFNPPKTVYTLKDDKGRYVTAIRGDSLADILDKSRQAIRDALAKREETGPTERRTPISVYQDRTTRDLFIGFKGQSGVIRLKTGFASAKDARSYIEEHADELQKQIDDMRRGPNERRLTNRPRDGVARREGDVSPDQFAEAFGFRGVQFGNYVEGERRQADLNEAFDGLMDLADVLDVPPQALSLNGTLGLAFGARGRGGNAAAHFEPDQIVINLTKTQGAGSLAHEWFHGFDNYFSRQDVGGDNAGFMTERRRVEGLTRQEVYDAFKGVEKALAKGGYARRMGELDAARTKAYWGTMREKAARGFEKYVVDRLAAQKATNDYLANIDENAGAYPTNAEMVEDGTTAAFDELFRVIDTRQEEGRAPLFAIRREGPRRLGIPSTAVGLSSFDSDASIKAHPDYSAAKSGDQKAAERLVAGLVSDDLLQQAAETFGSSVIYAPVIADEAAGHNAIPWTLAEYYATRTGADSTTDIVQANRAFHTGAKAMERLAVRAVFAGRVTEGARYVLVDDVTVMGSTLADMAEYIRSNGGQVAGVVTLANASRSGVLVAEKHRINAIERRFGDVVRSELGLDPAGLTGPEANYLLNFRDAEALRSRIAASLRERGERLGSKGIRESPEDQGEGRLKLRPTAEFAQQARDIGNRLRAELDRLGLKDVGLRLSEKLGLMVDGRFMAAEGSYYRKLITIALDTDNPDAVLDHEAIHALYDVGAFGKDEWAILSRKSRKEWLQRYEIADAYGQFSEDIQVEEGIAHAYTDWRLGRTMDGIIAKTFKKIRSILQAIGRAFGKDFRSAEDVFEQVASGEIGNRPRQAREFEDVSPRETRPAGGSGTGGLREQPARVGKIQEGRGGDAGLLRQEGRTGQDRRGDRLEEEPPRLRIRTPRDAKEAQQTMQGMIAQGQPLDRALRLPFQFFGGVDEKGRWKPGLYITDKATHVITTAKIDPKGRFGWLAGPVEAARAGLIDRYGLPEEYIKRDRERALHERAITMQGAEVLQTLSDQNVSADEARVLQAILNGEDVPDAAMQRLAEPIRQAIDELGQEAVSLGLVSPESFERNRGTYLHRVYKKHEIEQNNLQKLVGQIMGNRRKKIIGDELKGRGLFWDVDNARLMRDVASFQEGRRGAPVLGEKFRVVDNVLSPTEDMLSGEERGKVARRVFLPADQDVPARYVGPEWRDRGVWEVRKAGKNKVTLWRDYTKAEREKMGEILDARYTIGKTYLYMAHDLATGRFFKDVAENEDWSTSTEPAARWLEADQFRRYWNDREVAWVKVPDTTISNTGGKKRWGALSGKWVRSEIWRDLNEVEIMNRPSTWRMLLSQWKLMKTARSPVVHMNNVMSNLVLMDMQDVRMQDLAAGLRSFINKDKHWQDANAHGVFGADMMTQEIRDNVLKPILEEIEKQGQDGVQNSFLARAGVLGKFADRLWGLVKTGDQAMRDLYRVEDDVFRLASYRARLARGESADDAAAAAREQFLDYDIHAPWVNAARNSLLPFISYTYRAVPLLARAMATRPWKLAKYAMIAYALNALAYAWDDDGDEDKERASLRDEEQGYTWLGTPRMLRMPFRNSDGLPMFLDVRRWIPGGDVFDTNQGSSAVPVPAPLQFGGPLMLAFELALNKSGFTGEPITNELTDDWWDKTTKVGDYLWKAWLPSAAWVPNSWYWTKIGNAIKGATDAKGRPYSLPEAVASSFGIKMKPQDVETGLFWHYKDIQDAEQALRAEARTLARQRDRGLISQKAFDAGMQSLIDKRGRLIERLKELQRVEKK